MAAPATARLTFTKLVVHDLDGLAAYYSAVYGLDEVARIQAEVAGSPIDEIILGADGGRSGLILFRYLDREAPSHHEVILGFDTPDIDALFTRATAAGGRVHVAPIDPKIPGIDLIGFVADPEDHLAEVVQR
jgi:predicted enzyme related to lactoylglutathione lyase